MWNCPHLLLSLRSCVYADRQHPAVRSGIPLNCRAKVYYSYYLLRNTEIKRVTKRIAEMQGITNRTFDNNTIRQLLIVWSPSGYSLGWRGRQAVPEDPRLAGIIQIRWRDWRAEGVSHVRPLLPWSLYSAAVLLLYARRCGEYGATAGETDAQTARGCEAL